MGKMPIMLPPIIELKANIYKKKIQRKQQQNEKNSNKYLPIVHALRFSSMHYHQCKVYASFLFPINDDVPRSMIDGWLVG